MEAEKFDAIVIGAGPAGEKGAAQAAYFGRRVAMVERAIDPGGACANTGTLPSKALRETALHLSGLGSRGLTGVAFDLNRTVTARHLLNRAGLVVHREHERIRRNVQRHHITYIEGNASFADPNVIQVHTHAGELTRVLEADFILIATGSRPHRPPEVPFADPRVWDSDAVLKMKKVPETLCIIGAGVIGSEYACIFAALGSKVHLVDSRDRAMPFLDHEIADVLIQEMGTLGVYFHMNSDVTLYEAKSDRILTHLANGEILATDCLLYAAGRSGNTQSLQLANAGVEADKRGQIHVNDHYQTSAPHIYAAGDVIGFPALASTAMDQGRLAMCHAFNLTYRQRLAAELPIGIYTIPEVSAAGETEESAREKGLDFEIGRANFADNARAQIMGETGGMLKLIFDARSLKVLGVHIACERASEIITPGLFALRLGVGIDFFIDTVFNFPTLSEAYKYAAYDGLGKLASRGVATDKPVKEDGAMTMIWKGGKRVI